MYRRRNQPTPARDAATNAPRSGAAVQIARPEVFANKCRKLSTSDRAIKILIRIRQLSYDVIHMDKLN